MSLFVSPGTGATGAAALYSALFNTMQFAVTGLTQYTTSTGLTGMTGATGLRISVTTGPSGPLVTLDYTTLASTVNNLLVTSTYDTGVERATGATYNGMPVYRQAWNVTITTAGSAINNTDLISSTGYVDSIVNSGGYFATGNAGNTERYNMPSSMIDIVNSRVNNQVYGFPLVSTDNKLQFTSRSTPQRTLAPAFIWVDYTKK
jgi:hypothetical protein